MTAEVEFDRELVAPITEGEKVGTIIYSVEGDEVATADLIAQADVDEGSLFKKLMDWFKRLISSWF